MTQFFKIIGVVLCIIYSSISLWACTIAVSGKIVDNNSKKTLENVSVFIKEKNTLVYTDSSGSFYFNNLCKGNISLQISLLGYENKSISFFLSTDTIIETSLKSNSKILNELIIHNHNDNELGSISKTEINQLELFSKSGGNIGDVLKDVTGVTLLKTGSSISKPIIRGLHSNRILILNNGIRQEGQNWGSEHAPEIDPYVASKITVLKGAASARYGSDALNGALLIEPSVLPDTAGIKTEVNSALFSNGRMGVLSAIVEGKTSNTSPLAFRIQSTLRKGGNIHTPNYFLINSGLEEFNQSAAISYKKKTWGIDVFGSHFNTKLGIFSGSHIGNLTDLQRAFERKNPIDTSYFSYKINRPYQGVNHYLLKNRFHLSSNNYGKFEIVYALQQNNRAEFDKSKPRNDSLAALNKPELDFRLTTHSFDFLWEHKKVLGWQGSFGASFSNQYNIYLGRNLIPNFQSITGGLFLIEHYRQENYEVEFAIRYDQRFLNVFERDRNDQINNYKLNFNRPSISMGLIYKVFTTSNVMANLSSAWRAPSVNELFSNGIHQANATFEMGNRTLIPEYSYSSSIDFNFHELKWFKFKGGFFAQQINNFIFLLPVQPPVLLIQGAFPSFKYFQTNAFLYGTDFNSEIILSEKVSFITNYSLVRAKDLENKNWIYGIPSDRTEIKLVLNPFTGKNLKNTSLSISNLFVGKQFRLPAGVDYALPPNAYQLLNAELTYQTLNSRKNNVVIVFGVNNLLNTKYREFLNSFRYYTDEMGRNFYLKIKLSNLTNFKK
ncbi:MAG: TonB-dependent receptor [Bacteroidota bacterium]